MPSLRPAFIGLTLAASLLLPLAAPAAPLVAADTVLVARPNAPAEHGTLAVAGGSLDYRTEFGKLTLTAAGAAIPVRYADGTRLIVLQPSETIVISGDMFTRGLGGTVTEAAFVLAPATRLLIKNPGAKPLTFFDNKLGKDVLLPAGAVLNLETKAENLVNCADLAQQLKPGEWIQLAGRDSPPQAAIARVSAGLVVLAYENMTLEVGKLQVSLVPGSAILITQGRLKLTDRRLEWAGGNITLTAFTAGVLLTTPNGKYDLAPGLQTTGHDSGFATPAPAMAPPGLAVSDQGTSPSTAMIPIGPGYRPE